MLDTLTREINARWGLADQGRPLVQMLVATISNPATGGLTGFLEKFRKAGWGGMVNTWVGNAGNAEIPTTAQVEAVLGAAGDGFLQRAAAQLGLSHDKVIAAVAGVLPRLVDSMTPDGSIPTVLPAAFGSFAREGKALLGAGLAVGASGAVRTMADSGPETAAMPKAAAASALPASNSGWGARWPWLIGALLVIVGVSYCSQRKAPEATPPAASGMAAPAVPTPLAPSAPVTPVPPEAPVVPAAPPASSATPTTGAAVASDSFTAPDGAAVVAGMHQGMPMLRVFFDSGSTVVDASLADKAQPLVDFLQANPDAQAVISGFNDPSGDAARNAQLSRERATAVQAALALAGVAGERAVLEKPAETSDASASPAAARRVDVLLRR